jgi:hypothetical protein
MTTFQRCAISIIAHAWCKEFSKPTDELRDQFVKVYSGTGKLLKTFNLRHLSAVNVDFDEADEHKKFYSENREIHELKIRSEDVPYKTISILERYPNYIKGKDGYGNWFTAEVRGWWEVRIEDDENRRHGPYTYRITK